MREKCWKECIENRSSIRITPDVLKARSLLKTAKGRVEYVSKDKITKRYANYMFEGYYSSILELIHALLLLKGYNVNNHICVGFYIRDIVKRADLFRLFDDCRYKRNSLVYYGRSMEFEVAKDAINKCKKLIYELGKIININHKIE